jgi:hypothetical protein
MQYNGGTQIRSGGWSGVVEGGHRVVGVGRGSLQGEVIREDVIVS